MQAIAVLFALELLAAEDYQIRERSHGVLVRAVQSDPGRYGPLVVAAAAQSPSAEVRSRCARIAPRYRAWLADTFTPSTAPVWPCIDALPCHWPDRCEVIACWLEKVGSDEPKGVMPTVPGWYRYRRATELFIRWNIREEWGSLTHADELVTTMWHHELQQTADWFPLHLETLARWRKWDGGYPRGKPD